MDRSYHMSHRCNIGLLICLKVVFLAAVSTTLDIETFARAPPYSTRHSSTLSGNGFARGLLYGM